MDAVLLIDKEEGLTSRDVVNKVGRILHTKKVGHTGTLDPMATGVLVLCIGNATKLVEIITSENKEYLAEITLGLETDTLDITGTILNEETAIIDKESIIGALNNIKGTYAQEVPIYSAVKIKGKKLYEYARENIKTDLPSRDVTINDIKLVGDIEYKNNKTTFKIICNVSKGTYIRSLARDIATKLNTIGVMSSLRRTKQGNFNIENCYKISDVENGNYKITNINDALYNIERVVVNEETEFKILNGQKLPNIYNLDIVKFENKKGELLAIYKIDINDRKILRVWKMIKIK